MIKLENDFTELQNSNTIIKNLQNTVSQIKILIAEDNTINQLLISTILIKEDFLFYIAENGRKAVEELEKNEYHIVLMDLMMPEMNGYEASAYIRTKMNDLKNAIPIIAISADITNDVQEKCRLFGMNGYISKPYTQKHLIDTIKRFITK
jgi:CheY-like chemotaxis protein